MEMKINTQDLMMKIILITPIATMLQPIFNPINKIVLGIFSIVLLYNYLRKPIKKIDLIILSFSFIVFSYSLFNIEKKYLNINMIFYFPIWALYLTYLTNYYNEFIDTFVKNLRFVKWLINIWCFLICLSMIIPSSYEGNGVLVGNFKSFSEGSFRIAPTILLMGIISTIVYEVILYFLQYMFLGINVEVLSFIKILLIEVVYNMLIVIILYPLIKNVGYEIENEVKGDRILTRYF